jgi:hypothetical protein
MVPPTADYRRSEEWVRARRRLRDELERIRRAASLPLAAHAALLRLEPYRHLLDWEAVRAQILDAAEGAGREQARWPGDVRARAELADLGRWMDDVA